LADIVFSFMNRTVWPASRSKVIEGTLDVTYAAFDDDADGKLLLADYMENLQLCQSVKEGTIVA
jgi:hypothetical protein